MKANKVLIYMRKNINDNPTIIGCINISDADFTKIRRGYSDYGMLTYSSIFDEPTTRAIIPQAMHRFIVKERYANE